LKETIRSARRQKGNFNIVKIWRPLTQEELPNLSSGDTLVLRQNYLYNPELLPVVYVKAVCVEKRKRDGTFLLEGSDTPISVSLTEAGRYVDSGWYMTGEERSKLKSGDLVIIHEDSGERRLARYVATEKALTAPPTRRTGCFSRGH
jgi:hypothetical protein